MHASGDGASIQPDGRSDGYRSIVLDLAALIERVEASMKLIESVIAEEAPLGHQEFAANVVVLDDVTSRYAQANAALNACNAGLGAALYILQDTKHQRLDQTSSREVIVGRFV